MIAAILIGGVVLLALALTCAAALRWEREPALVLAAAIVTATVVALLAWGQR